MKAEPCEALGTPRRCDLGEGVPQRSIRTRHGPKGGWAECNNPNLCRNVSDTPSFPRRAPAQEGFAAGLGEAAWSKAMPAHFPPVWRPDTPDMRDRNRTDIVAFSHACSTTSRSVSSSDLMASRTIPNAFTAESWRSVDLPTPALLRSSTGGDRLVGTATSMLPARVPTEPSAPAMFCDLS